MITEAQAKRIAYNDLMVAHCRTRKQDLAIEKAIYEKQIKKRDEVLNKAKERVKKIEKMIFINHKQKFYKVSAITEEIKRAEEEWGEDFYLSNKE